MDKELAKFSIEEVKGLEKTPWTFGNQVLYELCKNNLSHKTPEIVIAKIWLIGRSYAAAIERRKKKGVETSDEFYENIIAPAVTSSEIDNWIADSINDITALSAHKKLIDLLIKYTGHHNISFCSKYLHFHKPDHFFIYDSRAVRALSLAIQLYKVDLTKAKKNISDLSNEKVDREYTRFYLNALLLKETLQEEYSMPITPRHLDTLLLAIDRANTKGI